MRSLGGHTPAVDNRRRSRLVIQDTFTMILGDSIGVKHAKRNSQVVIGTSWRMCPSARHHQAIVSDNHFEMCIPVAMCCWIVGFISRLSDYTMVSGKNIHIDSASRPIIANLWKIGTKYVNWELQRFHINKCCLWTFRRLGQFVICSNSKWRRFHGEFQGFTFQLWRHRTRTSFRPIRDGLWLVMFHLTAFYICGNSKHFVMTSQTSD